jgi:hypothetical protein
MENRVQRIENRVDKELAVEQKSRRGLYEYYRLNVAKMYRYSRQGRQRNR